MISNHLEQCLIVIAQFLYFALDGANWCPTILESAFECIERLYYIVCKVSIRVYLQDTDRILDCFMDKVTKNHTINKRNISLFGQKSMIHVFIFEDQSISSPGKPPGQIIHGISSDQSGIIERQTVVLWCRLGLE